MVMANGNQTNKPVNRYFLKGTISSCPHA